MKQMKHPETCGAYLLPWWDPWMLSQQFLPWIELLWKIFLLLQNRRRPRHQVLLPRRSPPSSRKCSGLCAELSALPPVWQDSKSSSALLTAPALRGWQALSLCCITHQEAAEWGDVSGGPASGQQHEDIVLPATTLPWTLSGFSKR